jgi:hypothetical protein
MTPEQQLRQKIDPPLENADNLPSGQQMNPACSLLYTYSACLVARQGIHSPHPGEPCLVDPEPLCRVQARPRGLFHGTRRDTAVTP